MGSPLGTMRWVVRGRLFGTGVLGVCFLSPVNYSCSSYSETLEGAQAALETACPTTGGCSFEQTSCAKRSVSLTCRSEPFSPFY